MDALQESAILTGAAVFAEFLTATGLTADTPERRLSAIAAFAELDPALGWAGNLRRRRGLRVAIRRGGRRWTFDDIALHDTCWRDAAGPCAEGDYAALVRSVADHVLCADTRPDDTLVWRGDPADPWPFGALVVGAAIEFRQRDAPPDQDGR